MDRATQTIKSLEFLIATLDFEDDEVAPEPLKTYTTAEGAEVAHA